MSASQWLGMVGSVLALSVAGCATEVCDDGDSCVESGEPGDDTSETDGDDTPAAPAKQTQITPRTKGGTYLGPGRGKK
jgi:hypothetical protein